MYSEIVRTWNTRRRSALRLTVNERAESGLSGLSFLLFLLNSDSSGCNNNGVIVSLTSRFLLYCSHFAMQLRVCDELRVSVIGGRFAWYYQQNKCHIIVMNGHELVMNFLLASAVDEFASA